VRLSTVSLLLNVCIVCIVASAPLAARNADWSRIRKLAAGTKIIVTPRDSPPVKRYFVAGDDSSLRALNLANIVEQYERYDIAEVRTARTSANQVGCAFASYFGGAFVGGLPGVLIGHAVGGDTGPALRGMMVGWSLGAIHVYRKCRHKPEKTIYLAP